MRIGCLQFAPVKGDVNNNLSRADAVLLKENVDDLESLDLLVLPELAFSGYYFKSLQEIFPHLEPTGSGISSLWARTVALKYGCTVVVGYPEKVDVSDKWPASPEYYNSAIIVNQDGETSGGYRKSHLYSIDETWALEGQDGFFCGEIAGVQDAVLGISMDIAPYKSPWITYGFAFHILSVQARLVIVTLAWPTSQDPQLFSRSPQEPDIDSLMYWMARLGPLIHAESQEETIVIFANRCGSEDGIVYAGTSAVLGIRDGEVNVYGILGRLEKEILIVDTDKEPYGKLVYRPEGTDIEDKTFYSKDQKDESKGSETIPQPQPPAAPPRKGIATVDPAESESQAANTSDGSSSNSPKSTTHKRARELPKLSLDTGPHVTEPELPNVPTPTGPSPTPISRRPRLSIPPAESWTQRYLDSHRFVSTPHPDVYTPSIPARIYGGEVIIAQSAGSVDNEQGQHFDWDIQQVLTPSSTRVEYSPTQSESTYFSELSSVHTGRSGAVGGSHHRTEPSRSFGGAARSSSFNEAEEMQEVLPKPRTLEQLATDYAKLQMEEMKKRQLPIRGFPMGSQRPSSSKGTEEANQDKRVAKESQGPTSNNRIPPGQDASAKGPGSRSSNEQQSSRGRDAGKLRARGEFRGEPERGREPSSVGAANTPRPKVLPGSSADKLREESRGRSRRTRSNDPGSNTASGTPGRKQSSREGSGRRSAKAAEPIDLSQFRMIEEYPSEDCPIHSSRSRSSSHDQNNRKPPAKSAPRRRSISARGQRNNLRMPIVRSNVRKLPPGVRKSNDPSQAVNHSDISRSDAERPHSALETRQNLSGLPETSDMRSVIPPPRSASTKHYYPPWEGDQKSWVDERLNTLSKSVPPVSPPARRPTASQVPKNEPLTPQAMLIVYDPVEGDNDNAGLAGQTLHCVAKTSVPAKKT